MAQLDLYIDTYSRKLVSGVSNLNPGSLPGFTQGDTISLRIYLLARTTTYPQGTAYQIINNADLSLKVALGPKNGTSGSTLYTQQYTWTPDSQNQYFYANLPLNTAAIESLIGTAESARAWFEVEYTQGGLPTTVYQEEVTIQAEVIEAASLVTPAGENPISLETAKAMFIGHETTGFVLKNVATGQKVQVYLADDGEVHFDPIP